MRRLATLAVVAALMSPTAASGQNYTFGDWARDQGYSPGDVMPDRVQVQISSIDSLDGIGDYDWTTTPTTWLRLYRNQISSIESGDFSGLTDLTSLSLGSNQLSSIESGDFSGLANLEWLDLDGNRISSIESGAFSGLTNLELLSLSGNTALTELNLEAASFSSLTRFGVEGNLNITGVSLRKTVVNQMSFATLLDGGGTWQIGIGDLDGITEMDLSGINFANITDLEPLYMMDDLTDLWLVDTENLDATDLDVLLDNLATIEGTGTEGILYMTEADYDAFNAADGDLLATWNAEPGHHVEFLLVGDVNHDGTQSGLDIDPFVDVILASRFDVAADMNGDGTVNGLDVDHFVLTLIGGAQQIPEPSTLLLALVSLGVVGGWRKWKRAA